MSENPVAGEQPAFNYRFGSAQFSQSRHELRVSGLPVDVEPRALEVLAYLLRHAGEVVTKEELLREVWAGRPTVEKVLPNAVAKLRRALGEANAVHLVTQARVGYRLDGDVVRVAENRNTPSPLHLAAGQLVPGRDAFRLVRQLGRSLGNEVWLAEQVRTGAVRVYKFALEPARLRALQREATLARVLREEATDAQATHFVELLDWNFTSAPYFLEFAYAGEDLLHWAETHLQEVNRSERIALFLQIAEAVATAHRVGVLHRDLKPGNVLLAREGESWQVRLTDFGSGRLLEPDRLEQLGITRAGFSLTQDAAADSSGTPLYIAPELFDGQLPTTRSDVYALGILFYQLIAGSLSKPMASGWEQDVADAVLESDIRAATEGDPRRRLPSVDELADRLQQLEARRAHALQSRAEAELAKLERDALKRSRARLPYLMALMLVLAMGVLVSLWLYHRAEAARADAERELSRATALNRFLNEDLIGRSNPLVVAKGQSASLKDILLGARDRVSQRFADDPLTGASIHTSLAMLLNMVDLLPEAEAEARKALTFSEAASGVDSLDAGKARALLARLLTRTGGLDESLRLIEQLEQQAQTHQADVATVAYRRYLAASARGLYHMNRGEYAVAVPLYETAIPLLQQVESENIALRDSMRIDLINGLTQVGRLDDARAEGERLRAEIAARRDDNGLVAAFAQAAVARTFTMQGQPDRAEPGLKAAAETIARLLGADHTRYLMVLSDLSDVAVRRGDWPAAGEYAQAVHDGFLARLGETHAITQLTRIPLGQVHYERGDDAAAENVLRPALEQLAKQLPEDNPQRQMATFWLAVVADQRGQHEQAGTWLAGLNAEILEAAGSDGLWPVRLSLSRALNAARRGDVHARAMLGDALAAFADPVDCARLCREARVLHAR